MKLLFKLVAVLMLCVGLGFGQGQAPPTGFVTPYAMAATSPSGAYAYLNVDGNGNLNTTGGSGLLLQIGGFVAPYAPVAQDSSGNWHFLLVDASGNLKVTGGGGGGGLTSVGLSTNSSFLTVGNSPLTSNGTITLNLTTGLTANQFLATPNGSTGTVSLRAIVAADVPTLNQNTTGTASNITGIAAIANGGTNANSAVAGTIPNATSGTASSWTATPTLGASGTLGSLTMGNATSGLLTLEPQTGALGTVTVSIPAATDTLVNLGSTQTLSNKTFVAPALGTPASGTLTNATGLPLNGVVSPTGAISTVALANNPWTLSSAQSSNNQSALSITEATAASGGTGNNQLNITTAANSASTALNISTGAISTVFPTAGINLTIGTNTGATNVPALNITTTWNNASITGPLIGVTLTNTTSAAAATFLNFNGGTSGATSEFSVTTSGAVKANNSFQSGIFEQGSASSTTQVCGGLCTGGPSAATGALLALGSDNSSNNSAAAGGLGLFRAGFLTNATPNAAALEGLGQIGFGYLKGSAIANVGDVVCGTTTAFTVTDCPTTPGTNIIGIATSTTNPIGVVAYGTALVKLDGALTNIGDHVCASTTTAGTGHDNGSTTTACTLGTSIGVIVADSGTVVTLSGSSTASVAMSTTLPLVQLHIDN